jgi:hypothetical protein
MPSIFRIHPAFGVARVGDADAPGFIGPEQPDVPANWNLGTEAFDNFKVAGRIKRQGVRFRVFEFAPDGSLIGEVLPGQRDVVAVEWTVHVANRKASFFQFDGPKGENGDFSKNGARNANVIGNDARSQLEIDPGPKPISGLSAGPVILANPNPTTNQIIKDLGDISTDDAGRLIFFGGHGKTLQLPNAPDIQDYVNNDGWFDDVSDGPISAVLVLKDGSRVETVGAWVSVAPPDFAPAVGNVVSLYETIWDVVVRNPTIPIPGLAMYRAGGALARLQQQRDDWDPATNRFKTYKPSYISDIADVLQRAFGATCVHDPPDLKAAFHNTIAPQVYADLGDPDAAKDILRKEVFKRLRDPNSTEAADSRQMPRGLGDEYCDENEHPADSAERANSKRFFSLTRTQYAMFAQWAAGNFVPDGNSPPSIPTTPTASTPEDLDRAALEDCVGGPFFPGIEVSWVIRNPTIYTEPFRFQLGKKIASGDLAVGIPDVTVGPGFLTQQMALPWQADFRDCKREPLTNTATGAPTFAMWWTGQRPDDVFPEATPDQQVAWTRDPDFKASDDDPQRYKEMVASWSKLGFVARQGAGKRWLETERS